MRGASVPIGLIIGVVIAVRGEDSVMEIGIMIDGTVNTLRFSADSDLVRTASRFHDEVGHIHGMGCPTMSSHCVTSRLDHDQ